MKRNGSCWENEAKKYTHFCFQKESVPRVEEFAALLGLSREELTRQFRAATGYSPAAVFRRLQLRRAKELLVRSEEPTAAIARAAAYTSARAFYRAFRRCVGITPTEYRRRSRT